VEKQISVRILWVKANKLLPVTSGGDIRSYNLARQLSSRHQLTFFSYYDGRPDPSYETELASLMPGAICVCTRKNDHTPARALQYLLGLTDKAPFAVSRFASSRVQERLEACLGEQSFDVAVCDFLDAAVNFPTRLNVPTVLFQHNVETEIWRRHAETERNRATKLIYRLEFKKMLAYESAAVRRFPHVIAVSEHDRKLMSAWVPPSRITVVATGVDLARYTPGARAEKRPHEVVFTGAMDWEANVDAVEYFCREIWPLIQEVVPHARFRIVGRNPGTRVRRLASDSVEVTGSVASVVEHLRRAAVVVVPLRIGGGTRLKIYEAMATGAAVVSTSVGAEGLDVETGRNIILEDDARNFAHAVTLLLSDNQLRTRYEQAAAELATRYGWPVIGEKFAAVLEQVAAGAGASADYEIARVHHPISTK
jgi:glycosyltransferase involved in cell wall biosynthesis